MAIYGFALRAYSVIGDSTRVVIAERWYHQVPINSEIHLIRRYFANNGTCLIVGAAT